MNPFSIYLPDAHDSAADTTLYFPDMRACVREAQNWLHVVHAVCLNGKPLYWHTPYRMGY